MASAVFRSVLKAFRSRAATLVTTNLYNENRNADPACDLNGNLWTRQAVAPQDVLTSFTYKAVPGVDTAIMCSTPNCVLTQVGGFNDSAGNIYVQLFNDLTVNAGDAPEFTFFVPMNSSFSWTPSRGGRLFTNGLTFAVSSTRNTYTVLATNIFIFAEGYLP